MSAAALELILLQERIQHVHDSQSLGLVGFYLATDFVPELYFLPLMELDELITAG